MIFLYDFKAFSMGYQWDNKNRFIKPDNLSSNLSSIQFSLKELKYENRYEKLKVFESFIADIITDFKKAAPRFEVDIIV